MNDPISDDGIDPRPDASLFGVLRALIDDATLVWEAETGYWRALAALVLRRARSIAILLVLALFFVFFALMALVVGLLFALAPLIGPWGALAVVTLALAGLAGWCLWRALRIGRRMLRVLGSEAP